MIDPTIPNLELDLELDHKLDLAAQRGDARHAISAAIDVCIRNSYTARTDELLVLARVLSGGKVPEHVIIETINTWSARSGSGDPIPVPTVGRKREHRDAAAKQKAYRERKAASGQRELKRWTKDVRDTAAPLTSSIVDVSTDIRAAKIQGDPAVKKG